MRGLTFYRPDASYAQPFATTLRTRRSAFVTFSCYRRQPFLGTARARDRFVRTLDQVRSRHCFQLIGYVVMPVDAHLLLSEPKQGNPSKSLQALKREVSRALRKKRRKPVVQLSLGFAADSDSVAFWQRRFYDFNVWSDRKLREKLDYMHRNPVQRKLVSHPQDRPWSSWSHYEKGELGLIRIDALGDGEDTKAAPQKGNVKNRTLEKPQGMRHPV